jgi:hypothetical protein
MRARSAEPPGSGTFTLELACLGWSLLEGGRNALPGPAWGVRLGESSRGAAQLAGKEARCPYTFRRLRRLADSSPGRASAQQRK